jgi:hypothetical protein
MSRNKRSRRYDDSFNDIEALAFGLSLMSNGRSGTISILSSEVFKDPTDKDIVNLGHGITLVTDKSIEHNTSRYSHLFKDGIKINDSYFRLGGLESGFHNKPYTSLIHYPGYPIDKECWGNHCIIDSNGKIILEAEKFDNSFYYLDGVIAKRKERFVNLVTGKDIVRSYSNYLKSADFYFVECNDYNKEFEHGIYKINFRTGEYEIFKK